MKHTKHMLITVSILLFLTNPSLAGSVCFGFWPSDIAPDVYQPPWETITHIACPDWFPTAKGSLDIDPYTLTQVNDIFSTAKQHNVKSIVCVQCTDDKIMDSLLAYHIDDLVNNISDTINSTGAQGIMIDFEFPQNTNQYTHTANKELFESLMQQIYTKEKSINSTYLVGFCTPPLLNSYEDVLINSNLSNYADAVFVMGYDYNWGQSTTAPNSPFCRKSDRGIKFTLKNQSNLYGASKLIFGLPLFGYDYIASSSSPGAPISYFDYIYLKDALVGAQKYHRQWDADSNTPYYTYQSNGVYHQIWYDDKESLTLKYQYVSSQGIQGIGFWAAGFEGNNSDIWGTLSQQMNKQLQPNQQTISIADFISIIMSVFFN